MNAAPAPDTDPGTGPDAGPVGRWARLVKALPLTTGLLLVAGVWAAGAVWSFSEQRDFARARGFDLPALLPLTIDGLALSLAVVAWSAALDGRAAVQARVGTFAAIAASAASNGTWAATRTGGDLVAVTLAAGVPLAAAVAFETLLAELRKGVHRRRGLPAPVAVAGPRTIRLILAPWPTFRDWRTHVLNLTAPAGPTPEPEPAPVEVPAPASVTAFPVVQVDEHARHAPAVRRPARAVAARSSDTTSTSSTSSTSPTSSTSSTSSGGPGRRAGRPGRPAGRSEVAAKVARLAQQYPDWSTTQIAARAGCSARTVRRHLNTTTDVISNDVISNDVIGTGTAVSAVGAGVEVNR